MADLRFERFSVENAEIVLEWRNSETVRQNSLNGDSISEEQHLAFLEKLAQDSNRRYFLVRIDEQPVATINFSRTGKEITWGCNIGTGNTIIPGLFLALVLMAGRYSFEHLSCDLLYSEVIATNTPPQSANRYLGIRQTGSYSTNRQDGANIEVLKYEVRTDEWSSIYKKGLTLLPKRFQEMVNAAYFSTD